MRRERQERAILLRTYNLSETSLIVHWVCQGYGLCKTVVKGAKVKNSKYSGKLELFSLSQIHFLESSASSDLHTLVEVELVRVTGKLRDSYQKLLVASYFTLLLEKWLPSGQACVEEFSLIERALGYLEGKNPEWRAVTYYERELCRVLGYSTEVMEVRKLYSEHAQVENLREKVREGFLR